MRGLKRSIVLAIALALSMAGLCAERITVIMPRHEMDLKGIWEKQTRDFERATGIEVEFIQMSWDEVQTKVMTDLAAGGGSYDVIEFDNGWVAKFAAADWVEPLDAYAGKAYLEGILPGLRQTFTVKGKTLGVAWNNDTRFFFYNKALLAKAGIKAPPRTWAEALDQAKQLKKAGVCEYPVAEYWNQEWALANSIAFYLYSFGGNYFDEKGAIAIDKPESVAALQFMADAIRKDKIVNPSSVTLSQEAAADLFYRGSSAFFFQGPPSTYSYANDPSKSSVVGQVEVASWLPAKSGALQATLTLPEAFAIPRASRNKQAAWKYIQYMISKEKDKERAVQIGSLPLFKDSYDDPALLKLYPYWTQFGEQSATARALPLVEWYDELVQKTIVAVQQMLLGQKTPRAAADELAGYLKGKSYNGVSLH
ncbi:MAG TPA: sugar ABC transporter substrate-binding protein [Spirochaetales bacterium]|nr:sugar ABC transporter substrate-binding protein [Spirochaetales bacterium]HRY55806.1 sugar ABC transporter substrate-binding protein [Spirochaetia bacterium]HRZ65309.1 sugar ABC transporter substrate-binding protein [Spirochaetia bacterium]